ncbi:MAG: hypothetical protein ABI232_00790 [Jatrophihabitantaceae bacterium]
MKTLVYSGLARSIGFLPQAIATLLASRLIISHYGLPAFDTYALVVSVMTLVPLNDLGVGAAVTQSVAAHGTTDDRSERAALTAARVLSMSTVGLALASLLLGLADLWPTLLGPASGSNTFVAIAMIVYGVSFVPGLGSSVLLAAERNHVAVILQSFLAPIALVAIVGLIVFDLDPQLLLVMPAVALIVVNLAMAGVSAKLVSFPWARILRELPFRHRYPGAKIRAISGPMLVINLAVPVAFQSDRIVLSHVSTVQAVANYSVVLQIFAPVMALIVAAAQPLWPIYTKARSQGQRGPQLTKILLVFFAGTVLCSGTLVLIADPVGHLIGGDMVSLGHFLPFTAAMAMGVLAIAYPLAMSLVDPAGLRFVATCAVLTVPVNIGFSVFLARHLGAPGPLIALFVVSLTLQVIPALFYARRREQVPGRHRADPVVSAA